MSCVIHALRGVASALTLVPDVPGVRPLGNVGIGRMRLPTEAVGLCTVTFLGINADSEIRVYLPEAVEAAGVENCVSNQVLSWAAYSAGSSNNTVRIVIIHPDYKIKEFEYVSSVGNQSIPVQQERDKWYSNPA